MSASTTTGAPVTVNLLTNSSDPDGYSLTIDSVSGASFGTVANNGDGTATYTPWASGNDSFTFTVDNGQGQTASGTVSITVNSPSPPNVGNVSATATIGTPITINLLANTSDPQGYSLTVDSVGRGSLGSVVNNGDGTITYAPTSLGTDTIQFSLNNGHTSDVSADVTINIGDANPSAGDIYVSTSGGAPVTVNLLGNSSDPAGQPLSVQSFGQGGAGSVCQVDANDVQYTPNSADPGSDSFSYTVVNSQGQTGSGTVYVTSS